MRGEKIEDVNNGTPDAMSARVQSKTYCKSGGGTFTKRCPS